MATVFALPSTANAANPPAPVLNATALGGEGQIKVDWDAPVLGAPGDEPAEYVVWVIKSNGTLVSTHTVVAPVTELTVTGVAAGDYFTQIFSRNAYGVSGAVRAPAVGTVAVTGAVPPQAPTANAYRPYANWDDLIDQEYGFWTGCAADVDAVGGRLPRDDEHLFWRQYLIAPVETRVTSVVDNTTVPPTVINTPINDESEYYWDQVALRAAAEWERLTNSSTFLPPAMILEAAQPNYKNSIAYNELFGTEYARLTTIPALGGFPDADDGIAPDDPATADPAASPIANDNIIQIDEATWAKAQADTFARTATNLVTAYGTQVNNLAIAQAREDVHFARRMNFVTALAEEAEQTDGPAFRLYTAYFRRVPDAKGMCFWTNALRGGWSLLDVSEFFVQSDEFIETYGEFDTFGGEGATDAAEFVALVYRNVLDRAADGAGAAFWTRQLQDQRYSPAEMLIGFSESAEFKNRMENEVGTGMAFIHLLGRMPTEQEYVRAAAEGWMFSTTYDGLAAIVANSDLYPAIVDSSKGTAGVEYVKGEYTKRSGLPVPAAEEAG